MIAPIRQIVAVTESQRTTSIYVSMVPYETTITRCTVAVHKTETHGGSCTSSFEEGNRK